MMTPYHAALHKCAERYRVMLQEHSWPGKIDLAVFNIEFMTGCRDGIPIPKLCRWLGYIQGVLIANGATTVEAERDWTRPLFRPIDFPENEGDHAETAHLDTEKERALRDALDDADAEVRYLKTELAKARAVGLSEEADAMFYWRRRALDAEEVVKKFHMGHRMEGIALRLAEKWGMEEKLIHEPD
jgi:hypothetical protein